MFIEHVDLRDVTSEDLNPTYRVYFWSRQSTPEEIAGEAVGWRCAKYRIREAADVRGVLD